MVRTAAVLVSLAGLVAAAAARPLAAPPGIRLTERTASATPHCAGCTHVGEGRFVIESPDPATVVIHMIGAVVATAHPKGSAADLDFPVRQEFDIVGGLPAGTVKLSLETSLVGVLRGGRTAAANADAGATVFRDGNEIVTAETPDRGVACGQNLSVNDRVTPDDVSVSPGHFILRAHCRLAATHPASLRGKAASAEFAPEPALDPIWVGGPRDPFHGVAKKDFGFHVTLRVSPVLGR